MYMYMKENVKYHNLLTQIKSFHLFTWNVWSAFFHVSNYECANRYEKMSTNNVNVWNAVSCHERSWKKKLENCQFPVHNEYIMKIDAYINTKWLNQKLFIHFWISFKNRELQKNNHKPSKTLTSWIHRYCDDERNILHVVIRLKWLFIGLFNQLACPHNKSMYLLKIAQLLKWCDKPHVWDFQAVSFYYMCNCALFAYNTIVKHILQYYRLWI